MTVLKINCSKQACFGNFFKAEEKYRSVKSKPRNLKPCYDCLKTTVLNRSASLKLVFLKQRHEIGKKILSYYVAFYKSTEPNDDNFDRNISTVLGTI